MAYQQVTFSTLKTAALNRMGNSSFWSLTEVGLYLNEALRVWNVLTSQWKNRQTLSTVASQRLYTASSLVTATVTDQNLLNEVQYHLIETANSGSSWSDLFTVAEVSNYLNDVYRRFVEETKLVLSNTTLATTPEVSRYDLSSVSANLARIVRLAWLESTNTSHLLQPADTLQYDWMMSVWPHTFDTPRAYTQSVTPQQYVDVIPAPDDAGSLDFTYTDYGATALSNTGVALASVPNDFTPFVKYGLLGVMFRKSGQAYSPERAAYCERRYAEGIALANLLTERGLWRVEHNEVPLAQESMFGLDTCVTGWQASTGTPKKWFPYGMTKFGVYPTDSANSNSLVVEGYKNAPVLSADGDYLDLGRWEVEKILDYVQHVALLKIGGSEFLESMKLYQGFLEAASKYNSRLEGVFSKDIGADASEVFTPSSEVKKLK